MLNAYQKQVVNQGIEILQSIYRTRNLIADKSGYVKDFCRLQIAHLEHEVFGVLFLDCQHRLIEFTELFRGTINGASVYPREVVKECLRHNAAAVIFTHNHPSGIAESSSSDIQITKKLIKTLALIDVTVLDHIVVGTESVVSFAERGLLP